MFTKTFSILIFSHHRKLLGVATLTWALTAPRMAAATTTTKLIPSNPVVFSNENHLGAQGKDSDADPAKQFFSFETSCNANGPGNASLGPNYAADDSGDSFPNRPTRCVLFGDQDQARYICLCEDRPEAIAGDVDPAIFPSFDDLPEPEPGPGPQVRPVFKALSDMCVTQFNEVCGPFPEPIEVSCRDEQVSCQFEARGTKRDAAYTQMQSNCSCRGSSSWDLYQTFEADFSTDEAELTAQCEASLLSCKNSTAPDFMEFQNRPSDEFTTQHLGCSQSIGPRYDSCWIHDSEQGSQPTFRCDCSGNEASGVVERSLERSAAALYDACQSALSDCEDFEPKEPDFPDIFPPPVDPPEEEAEAEDDATQDEDGGCPSQGADELPDCGVDVNAIQEVLKQLGCRTTPRSELGFGSTLGLALVLLLGRIFRRGSA